MEALAGKVAVVTGAASGIGLALARSFAADDMRVVLADIERPALDAAAASLADEHGDDAVLAVPTDVADGAQVDALRDAALDRFGAVHVVCNNAGVGGAVGPMWTLTENDWRWIMDVNLWGVIHGVRAFVPLLVGQGDGHIVNTASLAGVLTAPFMGSYCVTKHGVVALSESLAQDLTMAGSAVGVSVLCPGWVRTNIADSDRNRPAELGGVEITEEPGARELGRQLLAGGIEPAEVATQVLAAIRSKRFYVFTHPNNLADIRRRFDVVLAADAAPTPSVPL